MPPEDKGSSSWTWKVCRLRRFRDSRAFPMR
jgi:hypothetical protein